FSLKRNDPMNGQESQQSGRNFSHTRLTVLIFAVLIIIFSTITAILTKGSWASIVSLLLTSIGVLVGIYQLYLYFSSSEQKTLDAPSKQAVIPTADDQVYESFRRYIENSLTPGFGALVIYGKKRLISRKVYVANPRTLDKSTKTKLHEKVIAER